MPPFTESTTSSTAIYTTGEYVTYTPINTTTTIGTIYAAYNTSEERMKEYAEKVDKHVDQLEEDIEFLNNEREQLKDSTASLEVDISILKDRIEVLENENMAFKSHIDYLNRKLQALESKIK